MATGIGVKKGILPIYIWPDNKAQVKPAFLNDNCKHY